MSDKVISSQNLFIDTDRGENNANNKPDDFEVNLNGVNIRADKGQFLRLTMHEFSMYKTYPNVNAGNNKFLVQMETGAVNGFTIGLPVYLGLKNVASPHDMAELMAKKLARVIADQAGHTFGTRDAAGNDTGDIRIKGIRPGSIDTEDGNNIWDDDETEVGGGQGLDGTHNNILRFKLTFNNNNNGRTNPYSDFRIQTYMFDDDESPLDTYCLLGGRKINESFPTAAQLSGTGTFNAANHSTRDSLFCVATADSLTVLGAFHSQLSTDQFAYVRTTIPSNTLETSSLREHQNIHNSAKVHHSTILARVPIASNQFIHYTASSSKEFFMDLMSVKHLQNFRIYLTNSHGEPLPFSDDQRKNGNCSFSCVLKIEVIQQTAPNERFTPDIPRAVPPRWSAQTYTEDGHTRTPALNFR